MIRKTYFVLKVLSGGKKMNLNQLRYFVAAAETSSFTSAASQYYISQTAVTQQIKALEEIVGVPLFDRSSRPIALTPAGNAFLIDAKAILERVNRAMDRVQEASVGFVGSLRVGYTKGYEKSDISKTLRAFRSRYPNVLLSCYRNDTDALAAGLQRGEYDLIFTWDSTELWKEKNTVCRLAERNPLVAAVYSNHPFASRKVLKRSELKNESILYMTPSSTGDSAGDQQFYELYHSAGYQPDIIFRSNDAESILMMVAAGEGISLLPEYVTRGHGNSEELVFIPLEGEEDKVEIIAAWPKESNNPVLRRFTDFVWKEDK